MRPAWTFTTTGFVTVHITEEMRAEAEKRNQIFYEKYGNAGTHRTDKSRQRMTGYLAEMAVKTVFPKLEFSSNPQYDFVHLGKTFDVKAQGCNSEPGINFVGTLYEEQRFRDVNFYIFTRVKNDSSRVWIAGFITKDKFLQTAKLIPAGTKNNNFTYDQSRYEIEYGKLIRPKLFLKRDSQ